MNASNPRAYTLSGIDACRPMAHPHCNWHRAGTKPLTSTSQGDVCLPMPVWSCAKTLMSNSVSRERSPPCCRTHVRLGEVNFSTTCANNACCKWPQAMKTPTTRTLCATIPSAHCCVIACRKPVPPWPHNRRYHAALKTASHAPRSPAWRWCWWIHFSPPIATHPRSSCSMSMTPRTQAQGRQEQARYDAYYGGYCSAAAPLKVSQGALSPPFSRPSVSPVPSGWRCSNAWSSGCVTPGPTPC